MLARITKIVHKASGNTLETPLLVPSFSSKGFSRDPNGKSEINAGLKYASEFIQQTCLISAYDIYYKNISDPKKLPLNLDVIFLDSGGYEVSWDNDYSAAVQAIPNKGPWSLAKYESVLNNWPKSKPAILVSYDNPNERKKLKDQINNARKLFRPYGDQLHLFLLKPEKKNENTVNDVLKKVLLDIGELVPFDIIGITEKELGESILDRMKNIRKLRDEMDRAGLTKPIHVFGALDPLTVCLYFIAGAEIFDGLTWIRYAYHNGQCVYTQNHSAENFGLYTKDHEVQPRIMKDNIYALVRLEHKMREYVATQDITKLVPHDGLIRQAIDSLKTALKGGA